MQPCDATRKWFAETQSQWFEEHGVPAWFHGFITRNDAETILKDKPPGCFLVRVGETRIGYSLSYNAGERCRHFMINVLADGQFMVVGETNAHKTLEDLVKFYRRNVLKPFNEILTQPCGKNTLHNDYGDKVSFDKTLRNDDSSSSNGGPSFSPGGPSHRPPVHEIGFQIPQRIPPEQYRPPLPPRTMSCDSFAEQIRSVPLPALKIHNKPSPAPRRHIVPPPVQNELPNKLYPSIPQEMKSSAFVPDSTSLISGLYPWRNKMKHAASLDSLLIDQKPENLPVTSTTSSEVQHNWNVAASQQTGSDRTQWMHKMQANKLLNHGKKLKNKVRPFIENAFSTNIDVRLPHNRKAAGRESQKGAFAAVAKKNTTDIYSEPVEPSGSEANMANNPTTSTGVCGNNALFVPVEEYKRPPPFAPGF